MSRLIRDLEQPGKALFLVGGQFGSEGKGLVASWLAENLIGVDIATTNAGAQAGHTVVQRDGTKKVFFHLPAIGALRHDAKLFVNAGAIIDPERLVAEIEQTGVDKDRIVIHPRAAVITSNDRETEATATRSIASTMKGVGAALAGKVMRQAVLAKDALDGFHIQDLALNELIVKGNSVTVEVPQGFDLSINHGLEYPHCTSRDCWVGSGASDAGIHPHLVGATVMVVRAHPIRVGSLVGPNGEDFSSGRFYLDSDETTWEALGRPAETTTVTGRIRRVATWSNIQYATALQYNRPALVFLNFVNYMTPAQFTNLVMMMKMVEDSAGIHPDHVYGCGPSPADVYENMEEAYEWLKRQS